MLVEVVVALMVLVVGAFSVFALLTISIQTDAESAHYTMARAAAQQELDWVRRSVYTSISGTPTVGSYSADPSTLPPKATVTGPTLTAVNDSSGKTIPNLSLVTVAISWPEPGRGSDSVTMDTYVSANGMDLH